MRTIDSADIECVLPWRANIGECPVWSVEEQKLYWVDILGQKIHRFDPAIRKNESFDTPEIVTSIALRRKGGLVMTLRKKFAFYNPDTCSVENSTAIEADRPQNRFNDGKCDPRGRFWAGTMDSVNWDQPVGNLFCFDASRAAVLKQSEVICSNGTGWSPDAKTMYYTESFRYEIFAYDFEASTGAIRNRRSFVKIDRSGGAFPDGMTVDSEGFVWSNIVGPGQIHRFDPDGKLERIVQLPVPRATACTFGGNDMKTLYVTSSYETLTPEQIKAAPLSGSLFAVATGIVGMPTSLFEG